MRAKADNNKNVTKKMEKGQVFSLDFVISMVALTAAVGLMIQAIEVNTYYEKERNTFDEMKLVAETAADLLVASNNTTCTDTLGNHLMNCLDKTKVTKPKTEAMIPNKYGYNIIDETAPIPLLNSALKRDPGGPAGKDFVEIKRTVFIESTETPAAPTTLSVKVWLR